MNWLDYLILAILLFSAIAAARKGFSREIVGLASAFFALFLGMWFYGLAGSYVAPYVDSPRTANLIGFLLVVLAVMISGALIGNLLGRFLRTVGLSFFDRLLGAAFGFVRGLLIAMAALTAVVAFGPHVDPAAAPAAMVNSRFAPYVLKASRLFVAAAPKELRSSFVQQYTRVAAAFRDHRN